MPRYLGRYVLQHEFAHCYDHLARNVTLPWESAPAEHWLAQCNRHYRRSTLAEFAACWIAGTAIREEAFNVLCGMDAEPLEREIHRLLEAREDYLIGSRSDLSATADEACQIVWVVLLQYAKLAGHMVGMKENSVPVGMPQTLASNADAMSALHTLMLLLSAKVDEYPDWPDDGWDELENIWRGLTLALGYRFEESDGVISLWLE